MNQLDNKNQVVRLLCRPQRGKAYLLNALNSNSEQVFMEALHHVIDAMNQDLTSNISSSLSQKL
ncbi:MAG: hypothetical protein AAFV28_06750 [Cyanobacteria bacterium J06635_13]